MSYLWDTIYGIGYVVQGAFGLVEAKPEDSIIPGKRELALKANELEDEANALASRLHKMKMKVRRMKNSTKIKREDQIFQEKNIWSDNTIFENQWSNLEGIATSQDGAVKLVRAHCKEYFVWFETSHKDPTQAGKVYAWTRDEIREHGKLQVETWNEEKDTASGIVDLREYGTGYPLINGFHGNPENENRFRIAHGHHGAEEEEVVIDIPENEEPYLSSTDSTSYCTNCSYYIAKEKYDVYQCQGHGEVIPGVIKQVGVRGHDNIDQICFWLNSGETKVYGKDRAPLKGNVFSLDDEDYLTEVTARILNDSTAGIQFSSLVGKQSPWYGDHAGDSVKFTAQPGMMITGLKFGGKENLILIGIDQQPVSFVLNAFEESKKSAKAESIIIMTNGSVVNFRSKTTGRYIYVREDLILNGNGQRTLDEECRQNQFLVKSIESQIVLESREHQGCYLTAKEDGTIDFSSTNPYDPNCLLDLTHYKGREISLTSCHGPMGFKFSGEVLHPSEIDENSSKSRLFCRFIKSLAF